MRSVIFPPKVYLLASKLFLLFDKISLISDLGPPWLGTAGAEIEIPFLLRIQRYQIRVVSLLSLM